MKNKFYLKAPIKVQEATKDRIEKASKVIELPSDDSKQSDLLYFSAIFVSSGENLNHAYFLGSELVAAEGTIVNKALDVEHNEDEIIGHIYERAYTDKKGNMLDISELATREIAGLDSQEMHIAIAGIIYKNRFPNLAEEVASGKWDSVSMECYYQDYDVKVGDLIINKREAESLGLATNNDSMFGKLAKVIKDKKEIASGTITRVLRHIMFSGCGIVKNPANPPSKIMETAKNKEIETDADGFIILDYDELEQTNATNNVTSKDIEGIVLKEESDIVYNDSVGICVSFKRRVLDSANEGPDSKVIHEDWCTLYDTSCTSFSRDTTDPKCLRNEDMTKQARACIDELLGHNAESVRRCKLVNDLELALQKADKALNN